jgi:hypothetical protein
MLLEYESVFKNSDSHHRIIHRLATVASAPGKAIEQSGESPDRGNRYRPVSEGNCVFNRIGGEQLEEKEQSVTKVNSIRPSLSDHQFHERSFGFRHGRGAHDALRIVDSRTESFAFLGYSFREEKIYPRRESLSKIKARLV